MKEVVAIDLFCGIGGLTYGLESSGIKVVAGFDIDDSCRYAYEMNNNSIFYNRDVSQLKGKDLLHLYPDNSIKVLAGCAPCQPYSSVSNGKRIEKEKDDEPLRSFDRLVSEMHPDIVTMENVPNLISKGVFKEFKSTLDKLGYKTWFKVVFAPDYGVPQARKRFVLLASKLGDISLVNPVYSKENYATVRDAIGCMEPLKAGESSLKDPMHRARNLSSINLKRIRASVQNGSWEDWDRSLVVACHKKESGKSYKGIYGRMSWEKPAPTITTQFSNYGSGRFGHPEQDRALTPREAALIQTFPSDYEFLLPSEKANFMKTGKWIGNAVPVKLAESIGTSILRSVFYL